VAVNLSPARESLLDNVSLMRTFKSVPTGTKGTTRRVVVVERRRRGLVCAEAINGIASKIDNVRKRNLEQTDFMVNLHGSRQVGIQIEPTKSRELVGI
jgi:hypothetical protein